ncbi:MAG TPA: hypothetical protein VKB54_05880 [Solirubrobacteraceae bacterium]|jgi:hypothetical protein|nr:hypothetical protein [Solirubrobacteraceae bacterium]
MRRLLTTLATILCLAAPAAAHADSGVNKLLIDACRDEHVNGHYTQAQYKKALDELPADADEYSACRDVIERARLAALGSGKKSGGGGGSSGSATSGAAPTTGGGGGSGGSSGSSGAAAPADPLATATPAQKTAVAKAGQNAQPVDVGGKLVEPGKLGLGTLSGSGHDVPTSLVALIALLAAGALGAGGWWLWTRVLAGRFG